MTAGQEDVALTLGVSHTYVQKIVREFVGNPDRILRELRASPGVAKVDTFERAQRETHRDKESGYLRSLNPWRTASVEINGTTIRLRVPTKALWLCVSLFSNYINRKRCTSHVVGDEEHPFVRNVVLDECDRRRQEWAPIPSDPPKHSARAKVSCSGWPAKIK